MKRSEINQAILFSKKILERHQFYLPFFAHLSAHEWQHLDQDLYQDIVTASLGWDVTDFGGHDFAHLGLTLFTIRNRSSSNNKPYAEKIMICQAGQVTPMHYHWNKMEDIINRGGGNLVLTLYQRDEQTDQLDLFTEVQVEIDGIKQNVSPGEPVVLKPGQSICLPPYLYHSFSAEDGTDYVLAGEVSMANNDLNDNRFLTPSNRYSHIEEDELPIHLLCSDYPTLQLKGSL
jgi:D-lyxose ketol-isomerase